MLLLALTAAVLAAPPPPAPPAAEVLQQLQGIESAVLRGKADDVRLRFQDQARARPADVLPRVYLAWCTLPSDDAWNQLKAIAALNPENPWVHLGMGRIYTAWKMKDQARAEYQLILAKDPNFVPALAGLAQVKFADGDFSGAEGAFRVALAQGEDAAARGGLGLSLLQQNKPGAKAELEKAIKLWPDQPPVLQALLKLHREAKDTKAAGEVAFKLADLTPRDATVRQVVADLRYESGDKAEAAKEYEKLLRVSAPTVEVLTRLEGLYRDLKNVEGEERALQTHAALEKTNPAPALRLAELAEGKGNAELAEGHLLEAIDRDPSRAASHLLLGRSRVKRDALYDGLNELRAAAALTGEGVEEAKKEVAELEKKLKLPSKPAKGSVDAIYGVVAKSLNDFYLLRKKEKPALAGELKVRVKVQASGEVELVDLVSDTVGDPLLAGHIYFALHDAQYPKQKREPVFEFELGNVKKGK